MARARNIKPSFFTNDALADLDPLGRLLFIGMWTIADYKGCLEYKPKRLKVQLLPYDDCDVEKLAINLEQSGFIKIYSVSDQMYIRVVNFEKHQNPHKNERDKGSDIPGIDDADSREPIQTRVTENIENNRDKNGNTPDKNGSDRADSLLLIPDSLQPESLSSTDVLLVASIADDAPRLPGMPTALDLAEPEKVKSKVPECPHQKIIDLYHEILPMCPRIRDWTEARAKQLRVRWNESRDRQSIDYWRRFFEYVGTCDFLVGKVSGKGGRPFVASLDWMVKAENFTKIREERYAGA